MGMNFSKYLIVFLLTIPNFCYAISASDRHCLVVAVYKEARGESYKGKLGVAEVIRNRVGRSDFKPSICGVVKQRGQFPWYNGYRSLQIKPGQLKQPQDKRSYAEANKAVVEALQGSNVTHGSLYFVHRRVVKKQRWLKKMKFQVRIGSHVYYK